MITIQINVPADKCDDVVTQSSMNAADLAAFLEPFISKEASNSYDWILTADGTGLRQLYEWLAQMGTIENAKEWWTD